MSYLHVNFRIPSGIDCNKIGIFNGFKKFEDIGVEFNATIFISAEFHSIYYLLCVDQSHFPDSADIML